MPGEQRDVEEHSHAFWRDGEEKRVVKVIVRFFFDCFFDGRVFFLSWGVVE